MRTFSAAGREADWTARDIELSQGGSTFTVHTPAGDSFPAEVPLAGDFNVVPTNEAYKLGVNYLIYALTH